MVIKILESMFVGVVLLYFGVLGIFGRIFTKHVVCCTLYICDTVVVETCLG